MLSSRNVSYQHSVHCKCSCNVLSLMIYINNNMLKMPRRASVIAQPDGAMKASDLAFGKDGNPLFPFAGVGRTGPKDAVSGAMVNVFVNAKVAVRDPKVVGRAVRAVPGIVEIIATVGDAFTLQLLAWLPIC